MRAGELRHRVTLQARVEVVDPDTGYRTWQWQDVAASLPAKVEGLSGGEFMAGAAGQSQVTGRVKIRWQPGVTPQHRLIWLDFDQVLDIQAVLPDNRSGREWLTLMYAQGVGDG